MNTPAADSGRSASKNYWLQRLASMPKERAQLRADAPDPAADALRSVRIRLPPDVRARLQEVVGDSDLLVFVAVSAALCLVLYRDTGCRHVVFAAPSLRRTGEAPNTFVHDLHVGSDLCFRDALEKVRLGMLEADRQRAYPFAMLLDALGLQPSAHGLFDVLFVHTRLHAPLQSAGQTLTISVEPDGRELWLNATYVEGRHAERSVTRLLERTAAALGAGLAHPDLPVAALALLDPEERRRVLVSWNPAPETVPDVYLDEFVAKHAAESPNCVAAVDPLSGDHLTYAELDRRATAFAEHLVAAGVEAEDAIGLCLDPSPQLLIALIGVLKAGAAYVPLDPSSPAARLQHIVEDAAVRLIVTGSGPRAAIGNLPTMVIDFDAATLSPAQRQLPLRHPHQLAYIMYTSGSTGRAKGVMVGHRSLMNYLVWAAREYAVHAGQGVPVASSPAFDLSVTSLLAPLVAGQRVVLNRDLAQVEGLSRALATSPGFSLIKATPSHLLALGDTLPPAAIREATPCLVVGGEALREAHLARWREAAPGIRIINEYGPTETTVGCCTFESREPDPSGVVPIGRPIANTCIYLLDADFQPVPDDVPGEIFVGGAGVARGYRSQPALTAERFVPDPFSDVPGGRLYRTSDMALRRADGNLEFLGRTDRQLKLRGYRIEPGEIEAALLDLPGVKAAGVVLCQDSPHHAHLVAYVVPDGVAPSMGEIVRHLKQRVPEYMVPSSFVAVESLPLTTSGKLDYAKLTVLVPTEPARTDSGDRATTEAEQTLLEIWRDVLEMPALGVNDNFLEFGGDSIVSIRVVGRARQAGLKIQPSQMFEHPTVAALARVAEPWFDVGADEASSTGPIPLTPIQHWFFDHTGEAPDRFCQTRYVELGSRIDADGLEQALRRIVERHDALRLRFTAARDGWEQAVSPEERSPLVEEVDLSAAAPADWDSACEAARERTVGRLNLSRGPLVQAALITFRAEEPQRLFVAVHHLAVDHLSWLVLLDDLETALRDPMRLRPAGTSFSRWARLLTSRTAAGAFDDGARFWQAFASEPETGGWLPGVEAEPDAGETGARDRRLMIELDERETTGLVRDMHRSFNTEVRDALLTALALALTRLTGDSSVRVNLESSGRAPFFDSVDITRTVGWFTALYPVALDVDPAEPLSRNLVRVKEQLRCVPGDGAAFGATRYLRDRHPIRDSIARLKEPAVCFNYLGRMDHETRRHGLFRPLPGNYGYERPTYAFQAHRLEVNAIVVKDRLRTEFVWQNGHRDAVTALAGAYVDVLRALIAQGIDQDGPGCTPSDFPFVNVDETTLSAILDEVEQGGDASS